MAAANGSTKTRQTFLYFAPLTLLVYLLAPEYLLDIPTSYMLKNQLHASASQVSMFRLLTAIPIYLAVLFGLARDIWNPFGRRDRGFFFLFAPITAGIFIRMAASRVSYTGLLVGMLLAMTSTRFIVGAYQGLLALVGQETLMSGRLSTLFNIFSYVPLIAATFASGFITSHLSPGQTFVLAAAIAVLVGMFGFWKPRSVFSHTYEKPQASTSDFLGDVKRIVKHRAIYPAVLIKFLWAFTPGTNTPVQFYLTEHLHTSDAAFSYYLGTYFASFVPTFLLYGYLCTRIPQSKLLWLATIVGLPGMIPLALIHTGNLALLMAVPMGLMSGLGNAAFFDLCVRSCPPGLQGTLMMMAGAIDVLGLRGGDVVGSWLYGSSASHGFLYCVIAATVTTASIMLVIPWIPKQLIATADGEPNPAVDAALLVEIGQLPCG